MKWTLECSHNPNSARIILPGGEKLTAYMPAKKARAIVDEHNRVVEYLLGHIDKYECPYLFEEKNK